MSLDIAKHKSRNDPWVSEVLHVFYLIVVLSDVLTICSNYSICSKSSQYRGVELNASITLA